MGEKKKIPNPEDILCFQDSFKGASNEIPKMTVTE